MNLTKGVAVAEITVDLIKKLREKTQVGMMDCKKALIAAEGDLDKAVESLRKKGASVAAKRADNAIENGTIQASVAPDYRGGTLVEVCCETDFSANTQDMIAFAQDIANHLLASRQKTGRFTSTAETVAQLMTETLSGSKLSIQEQLNEILSKISEKIELTQFAYTHTENGVVNTYIHPGANLGVMVELTIGGTRPADITSLVHAAKDVCMQVAVTNPLCITPEELDSSVVSKERELFTEQLKEQGKPAQIIEKIIEGKLRKFYENVCLHNQKFIKDDKITVAQMLKNVGKTIDRDVHVTHFVRFAIGKN